MRDVAADGETLGDGGLGRIRVLRLPRLFWGLRLYLVCTPTGMPILWALANPKMDEREVLQAMLDVEADLLAERPGLLLIDTRL
ncbi:hypothetical protein GCM10010207_68960 [Streptomyces atratus]|uniref:hypothetical protein n=1 Tax=Streptomyces atratus TaxID=1893 RepID=UPI0019B128E8|nr:hypothetical protein [Streptomyces atratus]GGT59563.1 hypothetical protein GCM10010207_68960 [Streptomyces atratus]